VPDLSADTPPKTASHTSGRHEIARIAHRAGNAEESLRLAITAGVDWIETDLWYAYGRLHARHERGVWRLPLLVDKWNVRVVRSPQIRLGEILPITAGGPRLFLDLKGTDRRLPAAVIETLRRHDALDRAAVCGQYWPLLDEVRRLEPRVQVFHSLGRVEHVAGYAHRLEQGTSREGVSVANWLLTPELIGRCKQNGIKLFAWTVNECERAVQLLEWGVDGIISDRLDLLANLP